MDFLSDGNAYSVKEIVEKFCSAFEYGVELDASSVRKTAELPIPPPGELVWTCLHRSVHCAPRMKTA